MKVLLDLQYLNVATTGIKTYMMELAKAAKTYPHPDIEWIFTHDPIEQAADHTFKNPSSKFQRLNYHLDYFRWKEFQLPDLVKKHQPDVLICPDFVSPAASLSCRRMTVLHDAFFWQMPQNYPRWWRKYFLNLIRKGLKEKTEIITTTSYSKKALQKHLGEELPIHVVYQSPKSLTSRMDKGIITRNNLDQSPYFFHLGTFDKRKNLPVLVQAFKTFLEKENKDFKLVLAGGPGQSNQMNDFPIVEKLVSDLGLQDRVILPGYVKDEEIIALYQHAFGYVFPSENEGFGIPILEAMGFGIPVIHSDQAALIEVSDGAGLIAKTGDASDLAEKMILLGRDKSLREDLIQKGLFRRDYFSPQKFLQDFQQLILDAAPTL
ncbi:glycosyltransferase involved in cell wall biosynthesis [Algoriphagus iocasae]|jgi:glycosyltransferase involved in cell wall biosynthesis|uniref:Glycosyltransferase involved in cell wall biosynthesis n=1 Tax=Algoriphagus iocasae TaxID=1836499 RepID=A0A841MMM5_9BACT|nr:glycosyltransferase family 1 protein [Algoriphagus iocasae]MBB6326709.1 glycosyltransferase involved in cell wall biosynthesis [Algoriphagus iocasae]